VYSSLCAFAINDDGTDTLSSASFLQNFWIRPLPVCLLKMFDRISTSWGH